MNHSIILIRTLVIRSIALSTFALAVLLAVSTSYAQSGTLFGVSNTGVSNNVTSRLVTIDPATGAGTVVGEIGSGQNFSTAGLAYDPLTDTLFGNVGRQLLSINPATGVGTSLGFIEFNTGFSLQLDSLAFDVTTNTLLGFDTNTNNLLTIDLRSAPLAPLATQIGPTGFGNIRGLTFDPSGTLFGVHLGNELITINPATGAGTSVGSTGVSGLSGLASDSSSNTLFSANSVFGIGPQLISIDPMTGSATVVGPIGIAGVSSLVYVPAVIPEPSSLVLLSLAGLAMFGARKRRQSRGVLLKKGCSTTSELQLVRSPGLPDQSSRWATVLSRCGVVLLIVSCMAGRVVAQSPPAPSLSVEDSLVFEDGSVTLSLSAGSNATGAVQTVVVLSGIPAGWDVDPNGGTFDSATGTWAIALALGETISEGPILSPPADSDVDIPSLAIDVTSTDPATGLSSTTSGTITVTTDAVADAVSLLSVADITVLAGQSHALDIETVLGDDDGSESISRITISDVPDDFFFGSGTSNGGGLFTFSLSDLPGLELFAPSDFLGEFEAIVTAFSTETMLTDGEFDLTNNTASVSSSITITVVPEPSSLALLGMAGAAFLGIRKRLR